MTPFGYISASITIYEHNGTHHNSRSRVSLLTEPAARSRYISNDLPTRRVIGMATASMLARGHKVTIVARNLPGDEASIEWASPWAGASFVAGGCASAEEAKMQLDAFAELWRWSVEYPESSVKRIMMEDFHDDKTEEQIWWKNYMPKVRNSDRCDDSS